MRCARKAPSCCRFHVRSGSYLKNKQKQKSAPSAFRLTALEALITPKPETHISPYLPVVTHSSAPFLMPVHFTLPYGGKPMHLVCVFQYDQDPVADEDVRPIIKLCASCLPGCSEQTYEASNSSFCPLCGALGMFSMNLVC